MSISWAVVKTGGRYALTAIGATIATLGAVGVMSQSDTATATQAVESIAKSLGVIATSVATLAGIAAGAYATIRGMLNSTPAATVAAAKEVANDPAEPQAKLDLIATVDAMPEVKGVVTKNTPAGKTVAAAVPSPTVVPAGTEAAVSVATAA